MDHAVIFSGDFCGKRAEGQKNSSMKCLEFFIMHPSKGRAIRGREEKGRNVLSKATTCSPPLPPLLNTSPITAVPCSPWNSASQGSRNPSINTGALLVPWCVYRMVNTIASFQSPINTWMPFLFLSWCWKGWDLVENRNAAADWGHCLTLKSYRARVWNQKTGKEGM